jgi:hypothetical protein
LHNMNWVAHCYKFGIQVKILLSKVHMLFRILWTETCFKLNFETLQNKYVRSISDRKSNYFVMKMAANKLYDLSEVTSWIATKHSIYIMWQKYIFLG